MARLGDLSAAASDFDLAKVAASPFDRIRKRDETDKEGVAMWVTISGQVRTAAGLALERSEAKGEAYLFASTRRRGRSWSW